MLTGDVVSAVSALKQQIAGEIIVPASFQLVHTLMRHNMVDELRLKVFPVVLGTGGRMFGQASGKKPLRLVDAQTIDGGIACLTYEPVRKA